MSPLKFYEICRQAARCDDSSLTMAHDGRFSYTFKVGPYEGSLTYYGRGLGEKGVIEIDNREIIVHDDGNKSVWINEPTQSEIIKLRLYL